MFFFENDIESKVIIVNNNPLTLLINLFEIKDEKKNNLKKF